MLYYNGKELKKIIYNSKNVSKVIYNGNVVWVEFPSTYTRLAYIEATGTQYIDTGVRSSSKIKIESEFAVTNTRATRNYVFGVVQSNGTNRMQFSFSGQIQYGYGTVYKNPTRAIDTSKHIIQLEKGIFTLDNVIIQTIQSNDFESPNLNIVLCALNNETEIQRLSQIKIYSAKLWDNDILIRNFIPARRNSDNEIGLYDTVSGVLYTNQGTGEFIAGEL